MHGGFDGTVDDETGNGGPKREFLGFENEQGSANLLQVLDLNDDGIWFTVTSCVFDTPNGKSDVEHDP